MLTFYKYQRISRDFPGFHHDCPPHICLNPFYCEYSILENKHISFTSSPQPQKLPISDILPRI